MQEAPELGPAASSEISVLAAKAQRATGKAALDP